MSNKLEGGSTRRQFARRTIPFPFSPAPTLAPNKTSVVEEKKNEKLTAKVFYGRLSPSYILLQTPMPTPLFGFSSINQKFELIVKWVPPPQNSKLLVKPADKEDWEWSTLDFNKDTFAQCRDTRFFQLNCGMPNLNLLVEMGSVKDWDIFSLILKYEGASTLSHQDRNRLSLKQMKYIEESDESD